MRHWLTWLLMCVPLAAMGCDADAVSSVGVMPTRRVFGTTGSELGGFLYPRAIAVDRRQQFLYIIDKTARVQRFGLDGTPQLQWHMPESESGKPVGISVAPDGRVFVADTHYQRIIVYDADGTELSRFGRYGHGRGRFVYPTDVAFGPDGRVYVSECGGNDRVQVFSRDFEYLTEFGSLGSRVNQFNRPQSLAFNAAKTELYIADSGNHRIVVTDPDGRVLRTFGHAGRGPGELAYPYAVCVLPDDTLLVCENRNQRLQHLAADGQCLSVLGRVGTAVGELQFPWAIDRTAEWIYVLDSGNDRVQLIELPRSTLIPTDTNPRRTSSRG